MAGPNSAQFDPQYFLQPSQQDLLLAALQSNDPNAKNSLYGNQVKRSDSNPQLPQFPLDSMNPALFASPQQGTNADFGFPMDQSPFDSFLDSDTLTGDPSFDFDNPDNSDLMIGGLPDDMKLPDGFDGGSGDDTNGNEAHEKRKSPEDDSPDVEGNKAQKGNGDDKTAKKPGRKPLTSEPTTKRKAQNRAAQRAFRERKEKHLKDLEAKVSELEKASDAANHENGLLRAQVERLQTELREYRKRLSQGAGLGRSPPLGGFGSYLGQSNLNLGANSFRFEFPRFGGLPGSQFLNNGTNSKNANGISPPSSKSTPSNTAPGVLARQSSGGRSLSPKTKPIRSPANTPGSNGSAQRANSISQANSTGSVGGFSPSMITGFGSPSNGLSANGVSNQNGRSSIDKSNSQSRMFQFNAGSTVSNSDSPSASSNSQYGPNSSCGTSPEPSHKDSPEKAGDQPKDTITEGYECHGNSEGEMTFCEKLNMACGNPRNPIPRAMSQSNGSLPTAAAAAMTPATANNANDLNGFDFLANQNGGQFNPVLFGDYRESQAAIVGDDAFTGGFFNDAFPLSQDFGSPFSFGTGNTPAVQKSNPLENADKLADGEEEEVVPGEDQSQLLSCHSIWDKLQKRPDFKDGSIDMDNLCSELRAKARCSESGVVVDNKDVDAALARLPGQTR